MKIYPSNPIPLYWNFFLFPLVLFPYQQTFAVKSFRRMLMYFFFFVCVCFILFHDRPLKVYPVSVHVYVNSIWNAWKTFTSSVIRKKGGSIFHKSQHKKDRKQTRVKCRARESQGFSLVPIVDEFFDKTILCRYFYVWLCIGYTFPREGWRFSALRTRSFFTLSFDLLHPYGWEENSVTRENTLDMCYISSTLAG